MKIYFFVFCAVLSYPELLPGQQLHDFQPIVYKKIDTLELNLFIKYPSNYEKGKHYPAIVFFYGGSWSRRNITHFVPHANHFTNRGMIAILADYRVKDLHKSTPFDAVADAKSAMRFIRANFHELSVDTSRIVGSGGSAGGHLAASTAMILGLNDPSDNLQISACPAALVLFNPVFDNGPTGFGYNRIGNRYLEISPLHNIRSDVPPTIVFLGTNDDGVPVETAQLYKQKMEEKGNRCDLLLYEGQRHGFFKFRADSPNQNKYYWETLMEADSFLVSLGLISMPE